MNDLQLFNFEGSNVRTVQIENEPYFVGKDVADILGYQNGSRDINRHVEEEDRQNYQNGTFESPRGLTVINESGLYSLILGSKLTNAKKFKRWVTHEVLPTIRKTGTYKTKPLTATEQLRLVTQSSIELDERVTDLEEKQSLAPGEYNYISKRVSKKVNEYIGNNQLLLTQKQRAKLYKDINRGLNEVTGIKTRTQLRKKDFEIADDFITNWSPSTATLTVIKQMNESQNKQPEFNYR